MPPKRANTGSFVASEEFHATDAAIELAPLSLRGATAGGGLTPVTHENLEGARALLLHLVVTASNAPATLDVQIQSLVGSGYIVLATFTRTGAVATREAYIQVQRSQVVDAELAAGTLTPGIAADTPGSEWTDTLRVVYAIVGTSYTFSVEAIPLR